MYTWNGFISPLFNTSIDVDQGSALSPILSAIYIAPIIKKKNKKSQRKNLYRYSIFC